MGNFRQHYTDKEWSDMEARVEADKKNGKPSDILINLSVWNKSLDELMRLKAALHLFYDKHDLFELTQWIKWKAKECEEGDIKIIIINHPIQDVNTENPQLIDGVIYDWCTKSSKLKFGETVQQWLKSKQEEITKRPDYKDVKAILLYDITLTSIPQSLGICALPGTIIRFDLLK